MIKHMIIEVSHKRHNVSSEHTNNKVQPQKTRENKSNTLSRSLWSIHFSPPLATSYQKVHKKCIVLNDSRAWSSWDGVEMAPWTKTSVDVAGAGGEGAGAGCTEAVAGVDYVALVSGTGTAADICPLGTLAKASVVDLTFFSSTSSWSCSTAVWISITFTSRAQNFYYMILSKLSWFWVRVARPFSILRVEAIK